MKNKKLILIKGDEETMQASADALNRLDGVIALVVPPFFEYEQIEIDQTPSRRVFTIDVGDLPRHEAEERFEELKKMFREANVSSNVNASEDYFIPVSYSGKLSKVEFQD